MGKNHAMEKNVGKCEVVYFGRKNKKAEHYLNGECRFLRCRRIWLSQVHESRNVSMQIQLVIKKANVMV